MHTFKHLKKQFYANFQVSNCFFNFRLTERLPLPNDPDNGSAVVCGSLLRTNALLPGCPNVEERLHVEVLCQVHHPVGVGQVCFIGCSTRQHLESSSLVRSHCQSFHATLYSRLVKVISVGI